MNTNHEPLRLLGFDQADLRALGTMAVGALVLIPTAAYLLGGMHFGPKEWNVGLDLAPLMRAGFMVITHITAGLSALAIGIHILSRRKGGARHRWMGRVWVAVMLGTATTGMAIEPLRFTPAHGAALFVFIMVPLAIRSIIRGDVRAHRRAMARLLIALVIVGLLSLMPGQLLHDVLFAGA